MDWEDELKKVQDFSSEEIASRLEISIEAADAVYDAISEYLDIPDEERD